MKNRVPFHWPMLVALVASACGVKQHFHESAANSGTEPPPDDVAGSTGNPGPGNAGGALGAGASGGSGAGTSTGGAGGPARSGGAGGPSGGSPAAMNGGASGGAPSGNDTGGSPSVPSDGPPPGGMGPGTPGPVIGGMQTTKEKVVVFLHIGHSDMAGRADGPAALRPFVTDIDPHLWTYSKGGTFRPAKEPTAGDSGSVGKAGPGMAILRTALLHAPDSYMISIGHGHSGAAGGYCPNFRKSGPLYALFMDAARELKGKVTFGGVFTMFGITEYHLGNAGLNGLAACLTGLIKEVRADLEDPQIPLMVGDWNMGGTGIYSPDGQYGKAVRPQIQMVPTLDPLSAVISTDGLPMQDDRHLNFQGHKTWAERGFATMAEKKWLPWATQ